MQDDILLLYPFPNGTEFLVYNRRRHELTVENDPNLAHLASYQNASRITTFLRPAPEQYHGGINQSSKVNNLAYVLVPVPYFPKYSLFPSLHLILPRYNVLFPIPYFTFPVSCFLFPAPCPLPSALCPLPSALCPLPFVERDRPFLAHGRPK